MKHLKNIIKQIMHLHFAFAITLLSSIFSGHYISACYAATHTLTSDIDIKSVYRIELIVFADARRDYQSSEQWQAPNNLSYPNSLTFIADPALTDYSNETNQQSIAKHDDLVTTTADGTTDASTETQPEVIIPPLMVTLDDEPQLSAIANTLKRRSRYQLLFHQSWYQSLQSKKEAPGIVINGGTAFGDHFQLEGNVIISRGRFLHITSDLWLVDWESHDNDQQLPWYLRDDSRSKISIPDIPLAISQDNNQQLKTDSDSLPSWEEELHDASYSERYRATNVYTLREYRRMKRDEIHYLDHPLFGVVIVISKYEQPEPDQELAREIQ